MTHHAPFPCFGVSAPPGDYLVSGGEPEGLCELRIEGATLNPLGKKNQITQTALSLVSTFSIGHLQKRELSVVCQVEGGQIARLRHKPYVSSYATGMFVHGSRLFASFIFPSISIFFIFSSLIFIFWNRKDSNFSLSIVTPVAVFGIFHILSLMRIGYLFLPMSGVLLFHAILKVLLVTTLMLGFCRSTKVVIGLLVVSLISVGMFFMGYIKGPGEFFFAYRAFCHLIPVLGVCSYFLLNQNALTLRSTVNFRYFFIPFILISVFDCIALDLEYGSYNSMVATLLFFLLHLGRVLEVKEGKALANRLVECAIVSSSEASIGIEQIGRVAEAIGRFFQSTQWAVYLDNRSDGSENSNNPKFEKLEGPLEVDDTVLRHAILGQVPAWVGVDGRELILLPVEHSCICIEGKPSSLKSYYLLREVLSDSYPKLKVLVQSILETESAIKTSGLQIRRRLGIGECVTEFGAIFADIVAFSQHIKFSGDFLGFFQTKYLPQLLKELGPDVFVKDIFGDELFLVVFSDDHSVHQKTFETAIRIVEFSVNGGKHLCERLGFKLIEFRVGANAGLGQVLTTSSQVSLSGPVIRAKRCQNRAKRSEPFFSKDLICRSKLENLNGRLVNETFAAKGEILEDFRWIMSV